MLARPIICGVDFSEPSLQAAQAAARLAARMTRPLHLVYALDLSSDEPTSEVPSDDLHRARQQLRTLAEGLRDVTIQVEVAITYGRSEQALRDYAEHVGADLIVIGAKGRGRIERHGLARRVARRPRIATLVVRGPKPFASWAARPLRVLLGFDAPSCDNALAFIRELDRGGPLELIAVHVYWPEQELRRVGLDGLRSHAPAEPELVKTLERELLSRVDRALGRRPVRLRLEPHSGRIGERLAKLADEEHADLAVVGCHGRDGAERVVRGSISYDLLQRASIPVACVPVREHAPAAASAPDNVLCATDFSGPGDASVALAYQVVAGGGTVHLVHVTPRHDGHAYDAHDVFMPLDVARRPPVAPLFERLSALVPTDGTDSSVHAQVHMLESNDPARAICQAAERLDAALICLGTQGRGAVANAVLGSVAQSVLAQTRRPVLLAHSPTP